MSVYEVMTPDKFDFGYPPLPTCKEGKILDQFLKREVDLCKYTPPPPPPYGFIPPPPPPPSRKLDDLHPDEHGLTEVDYARIEIFDYNITMAEASLRIDKEEQIKKDMKEFEKEVELMEERK